MPESGKILHLDQTYIAAPDTGDSVADKAKGCVPAASGQKPASAPLDDEAAVTELVRTITENRSDGPSQLYGYLISDDPAYLPEIDAVRALARKIGRDKLLDVLIKSYIDTHITHE